MIDFKNRYLETIYSFTLVNYITDCNIMFKQNYKSESDNYKYYKVFESLNSGYLSLNSFLLHVHIKLNEMKNDDVLGTYGGNGHNPRGNNLKHLLGEINKKINSKELEEISSYFFNYELIIRNFFSHGLHLIFLAYYLHSDFPIDKSYQLTYNNNCNQLDNKLDSIFLKTFNYSTNKDAQAVVDLLKKSHSYENSMSLNEFIENPIKHFFQDIEKDTLYLNTSDSRVFLKNLFYNKHTGSGTSKDNINNIKISIENVLDQTEKRYISHFYYQKKISVLLNILDEYFQIHFIKFND